MPAPPLQRVPDTLCVKNGPEHFLERMEGDKIPPGQKGSFLPTALLKHLRHTPPHPGAGLHL